MYHYRGAGLDNVCQKNGYRKAKYGNEIVVSMEDAEGLHKAIASSLIHRPTRLTGQEFRFLRIEVGLSQHSLGELLGASEQSVHQWENKKTRQVPGVAERILRQLVREQLLNGSGKIAKLLGELDDQAAMVRLCFEEAQGRWSQAA